MQTAPYGSWASPITPDLVTAASIRYSDSVELDGDSVYWVESRPQEGGRSVIVRCDADGTRTDAVPADFNARTRVHEYGGGAYAVQDGVVYASSFEDQRLYRIAPGEDPVPITPVPPTPAGVRFADFSFGDGFLVAVRERHRQRRRTRQRPGPHPSRRIVSTRTGRLGARLLRIAPRQSRRRDPRLRHLGSPQHALERHHAVEGRSRRNPGLGGGRTA